MMCACLHHLKIQSSRQQMPVDSLLCCCLWQHLVKGEMHTVWREATPSHSNFLMKLYFVIGVRLQCWWLWPDFENWGILTSAIITYISRLPRKLSAGANTMQDKHCCIRTYSVGCCSKCTCWECLLGQWASLGKDRRAFFSLFLRA